MLATANAARIPLADGVVHTCVTSPPFWSLRDYGLEPMHWPAVVYSPMPGLPPVTVPAMDACLGLEPTPEAYVGHIVVVFREVWRVLREDGTAWVNLGDSYARQAGCNSTRGKPNTGVNPARMAMEKRGNNTPSGSLKPKDLVGIPWRVAFALQADGWYLRSDILWIKPNCMPESVRDRPTKAHEYIFLLAKSKRYYYDADAIRETATTTEHHRKYHSKTSNSEYSNKHGTASLAVGGGGQTGLLSGNVPAGRNRRTAWTIPTSPYGGAHYAAYPRELVRIMLKASVSEQGVCPTCGKPWKRVVERIETTSDGRRRPGPPDGAAHMATDHPRLRGALAYKVNTTAWRPTCTCAGKPTRGPVWCGRCRGTGRETRREYDHEQKTALAGKRDQRNPGGGVSNAIPLETGNPCPHCTNGTTEGDVWPADVDTWPVAPAIVLDPFVGSGTTAVVCQELRQIGTPVTCVGLDLNHHYLADLARERLGLLALKEWEQGIDGGNGHGLEDLPLFSRLESPN